MEDAVRGSRFVLVIRTEEYKARFDKRKGGVGYEGHIVLGSLVGSVGPSKFIPVLWDMDERYAIRLVGHNESRSER